MVEARMRRADFRHSRCRRGLRLHRAATRTGARSRVSAAVALRLPEPGIVVRAARPARSPDAAVYGQGRRTHSQAPGNHPWTRLRALHQLRADERCLPTPARRTGVPHAPPGGRAKECSARRVPLNSKCGAVCHFFVLARRRCAGRTVELRDHRPATIRGAQRSRSRRARQGY